MADKLVLAAISAFTFLGIIGIMTMLNPQTHEIPPTNAPNDNFVYGIAKNGQIIQSSKVIVKITNAGDTRSTALHVATTLNKNDYLELYVGNLDDADDAIVKTLNVFALGM